MLCLLGRFLILFSFVATCSLAQLCANAQPLTETDLRELARELAPKVNLFKEVWKKQTKAVFYAGTTRDFLYWILGHFSKTSSPEDLRKVKLYLKNIPAIDIRDIISRDSDVDLFPSDNIDSYEIATIFGVRKLDFVERDEDEKLQGYIPVEKIELSRRGLLTPKYFGNGVSDLASGEIKVVFQENPDIYWQTSYAARGENHPVLLALRYLRVLAQDYFRRFGSDYPNESELYRFPTGTLEAIQKIFRDAKQDPKFHELLRNHRGKKWLNGSILKSFRAYTNATAAYLLFKKTGFFDLQAFFGPEEIESLNQFLFVKAFDQAAVEANWKKFGLSPNNLLLPPSKAFGPEQRLYHGAGTDEAFRSILIQGALPSESGSAGRGLYGVERENLSFAIDWKGSGEVNVLSFKVSDTARILSIESGPGAELFALWKNLRTFEKSEDEAYEDFCSDFGIDILLYPYNVKAFVVKNSAVLSGAKGLVRSPMTLSKLFPIARSVHDIKILEAFIESISLSGLSKQDLLLVAQEVPNQLWKNLKPKDFFGELYSNDLDHSFAFRNFLSLREFFIALKKGKFVQELESQLQSYVHKLLTHIASTPLEERAQNVDVSSIESLSEILGDPRARELQFFKPSQDLVEAENWFMAALIKLDTPLDSPFLWPLFSQFLYGLETTQKKDPYYFFELAASLSPFKSSIILGPHILPMPVKEVAGDFSLSPEAARLMIQMEFAIESLALTIDSMTGLALTEFYLLSILPLFEKDYKIKHLPEMFKGRFGQLVSKFYERPQIFLKMAEAGHWQSLTRILISHPELFWNHSELIEGFFKNYRKIFKAEEFNGMNTHREWGYWGWTKFFKLPPYKSWSHQETMMARVELRKELISAEVKDLIRSGHRPIIHIISDLLDEYPLDSEAIEMILESIEWKNFNDIEILDELALGVLEIWNQGKISNKRFAQFNEEVVKVIDAKLVQLSQDLPREKLLEFCPVEINDWVSIAGRSQIKSFSQLAQRLNETGFGTRELQGESHHPLKTYRRHLEVFRKVLKEFEIDRHEKVDCADSLRKTQP